ncbi:peroxisomal membrane protein PEX16-like [Spodoptera frugiperda]|uniref:Peroxisomal membrane protein PEX16 n=1 Tax=Spodoptera frugiperda TaxID=7108 RepID=A0A9R0EWB9_SPOFR|nr:peroxisomal membrane protein PEX16-like [Spodoptera frugiperda]
MDKLQRLYMDYKRWVITNPKLVTDIETLATWSPYLMGGHMNKSPVISELLVTLSKLVSLFNDRILRETYDIKEPYYGLRHQIKLLLTIIQYSEVFVEMLVRNKCGSQAKWTVITLLQAFKCSSALVLLFRYKELPIESPPIPVLRRKEIFKGRKSDENSNTCFVLPRSGRIMRRVNGSQGVAFRDWEPMKIKEVSGASNVQDLVFAESLHILKPLIHLASMRIFGIKSWMQWMVALFVDMVSLKLYNKYKKELSSEQQLEISRRKLALVFYLLRSPMYEGYSKDVMDNIPLTPFIRGIIDRYLCHWQDVYLHMWSS